MSTELFRSLPKVDVLVGDPRLSHLPHDVAVSAARTVLDSMRGDIRAGRTSRVPDLVPSIRDQAELLLKGRLRGVINATGIVVHTNLGRAPWAAQARRAAAGAMGWCNLEMELASGERGGRMDGVTALLRHLTGCEAAVVVNNNAAAVLLALTALAHGREVIVSRGELVEIGGSFRVPEVVSAGGAVLREVGATNRTRLSDFDAAITEQSAVLLRVHPSNYRVVGFTCDVPREDLATLGRERGLFVVEDLGSGSVRGNQQEPSIREVVASGLDLVTFSGDKLLGGPQAGIVVGRAPVVAKLRAHPLYRAMRVDKVILAALEATLALYAGGGQPPVQELIRAPQDVLSARADRLAALLDARGVPPVIAHDDGFVGGGAMPAIPLPSRVVRVSIAQANEAARQLRTGDPAIVARVAADALCLDVRTLRDDEIEAVADRVAAIVRDD